MLWCQNEKRRQLVREHPTLNGIDFLEVLDQEAPPGSPRQRTLLVHLVKPVPIGLTGDNVVISGGVQVTALWAYPALGLLSPPVTAAEQAFLNSYPGANQILVVRTDGTGDFSSYRLTLQTSASDPSPPLDFDRQLARVDFSFKVECPSEFDCEDSPICPPERFLEPQIDYLAKDYSSFRRLMLDRLSIILPDWQERNPADLGIALVEVLAYAGDHLSYYQDAVATEAYLGTARQRVSVRRHARLLDYSMHDGCTARAWVSLEVDRDDLWLSEFKPLDFVEAAGVFLTLADSQPGGLPVDRVEAARQAGAQEFEALYDLALYRAHNSLYFYSWGNEQCALPLGATRATLRDDPGNRLRLRVGDVLIFEEQVSPVTGLAADRNLSRRQAVRLTSVQPEAGLTATGKRTIPTSLLTDPLTGQAYVEIVWAREDGLTFPLCISAVIGAAVVVDLSVGRGNVVLVDGGRTIVEALPLDPTQLTEPDIAYGVAYTVQPAAAMLTQDPLQALPMVFLEGGGERWTVRRDLLNSGRFTPDFVVEREEDGRALVRFGEKKPVVALRATYRVGNGPAGNVGAEAIAYLVTDQAGIRGVRNPLAAVGGTIPETLDQVRLYAPQAFRTQQRAVTEADYATIAQRHPAVQRAAATLRWTGSWHTMFVTVDRRGGLAVDPDFESELRAFLEPYRLAGQDLEVDSPRFIALDIAFTICVKPGYFRSQVKRALLNAFSRFDLPNGTQGFFHPDRFTFGQPLYLSQVVAAAMAIPGVRWVNSDDTLPLPNRFKRWGQRPNGERLAGVISCARLEILRLDNDPNFQENGKLEFFMEGGL